jgi:hypothetical protein
LNDTVPNKDAPPDSVGRLSSPAGVVMRWWAAFASLGAGIIHLTVVSEHAAEWWLYGVFFMVLAIVQIAWAVQAMESDPIPAPLLFAAVNVAIVGLWFVSRTVGLPVGPERWAAEAVATPDLVCTALEAVVVLLLVRTLRRPPSDQESRTLTKPQRRMVAIGAVAVAAVSGVSLAANPPIFQHTPHQHGAHSAGVIPTRANSTASGE